MSRDWSTARDFGRSMQATHLLQEAAPSDLSGDDILFLLDVNEVPADAQPKKVTISGLGAATAAYGAAASGSAQGTNGTVQFNNEGFLDGSENFIFTGSGIYASGVLSPSYTTNLSSINSVSTSGYTLADTDNGRTVLFTNEAASTVTVPPSLTPGFNCTLIQTTVSGQVTIASGTGVALNSAYGAFKTTTRYSVAGVIGVASDSYVVTGDITV
jgi:hypothetical protein